MAPEAHLEFGFLGWFLSVLGCFSDTSLFDARSANPHPFNLAIDDCSNTLQVWVPSAVSDVVSVTHVVSINWLLAADFANFCHLLLQNFM